MNRSPSEAGSKTPKWPSLLLLHSWMEITVPLMNEEDMDA